MWLSFVALVFVLSRYKYLFSSLSPWNTTARFLSFLILDQIYVQILLLSENTVSFDSVTEIISRLIRSQHIYCTTFPENREKKIIQGETSCKRHTVQTHGNKLRMYSLHKPLHEQLNNLVIYKEGKEADLYI